MGNLEIRGFRLREREIAERGRGGPSRRARSEVGARAPVPAKLSALRRTTMKTTKAYLVEPMTGTIRMVAIPEENRLDSIRTLIGCDLIDMVRIDDQQAIVVDDNGLEETLPSFTQLDGYPSPLGGILLIIGTDENGEIVDVANVIDEVAGRLTIVRPVFHPVFEALNGPRIFGTRLSAMEVRLEHRRPTVIDEATH